MKRWKDSIAQGKAPLEFHRGDIQGEVGGGGERGASWEPSRSIPSATPRSSPPSAFPSRYPTFAAPSSLADPGSAKAKRYLKSQHYGPGRLFPSLFKPGPQEEKCEGGLGQRAPRGPCERQSSCPVPKAPTPTQFPRFSSPAELPY